MPHWSEKAGLIFKPVTPHPFTNFGLIIQKLCVHLLNQGQVPRPSHFILLMSLSSAISLKGVFCELLLCDLLWGRYLGAWL